MNKTLAKIINIIIIILLIVPILIMLGVYIYEYSNNISTYYSDLDRLEGYSGIYGYVAYNGEKYRTADEFLEVYPTASRFALVQTQQLIPLIIALIGEAIATPILVVISRKVGIKLKHAQKN